MKQVKSKLFWLVIVTMGVVALLTACGLPSGYSVITVTEYGVSPEGGILSLTPPGLVPAPPDIVAATPQSGIVKTPHTLEGRIGYCLDHHGASGRIPSPPSHIGRPQDSCTVCHQPSWETLKNQD